LVGCNWTPVWALPNVTLDDPIETSCAVFVSCRDERLLSLCRRHPALETFRRAFRDEFEKHICPTILMLREEVPASVKTATALAGFRDAICVSAVVRGRTLTLTFKRPQGITHSEAFDFYPWSLSSPMDGRIIAWTPALRGLHVIDELRPRTTAALGERSLSFRQIDQPLLQALLARWERHFAEGNEIVGDRRLFRALDMARAASRIPGGVEASEHDAGRSIALWVSAFEILAHDGRSGPKQVLSLLDRVQWLRKELKARDREVVLDRKKKTTIPSNLAGVIYKSLYDVRNDFIHGNPVTPATLRVGKSPHSIHWFAASLFRLALTAFLDLRFAATRSDSPEEAEDQMWLRKYQRDAEAAILIFADGLPPAAG
jgi:hypothetical protein